MVGNQKSSGYLIIVLVFLVLALFFGWLGYQPGTLLNEYARGVGLVLFGVALVVAITEVLGRRRNQQLIAYLENQTKVQEDAQLKHNMEALRTQLIREISSGDPGLTAKALRELDAQGWITDGTLANTDLSHAHLQGANLGWANFSGAHLHQIDLQGADVSYANFSAADLTGAKMARADLDLANMTESNVRDADMNLCSMNETDLTGATMDRAILSGATMVEAILNKAQGENVALNGVNLERANLIESNLPYVNMERAILTGANLGWANLSKANLEKANLSEANLSGANLDEARLAGADFSGAFLFGTRLSLKQLSTVKSLANATMPDGTKYEDWVRSQGNENSPAEYFASPESPPTSTSESPLDYRPAAEEA